MSYGTDLLGVYRQLGVYAGRILQGAQQPSCLSFNQPGSNL